MKQKLSPRFWLALTLFSLIGQVAWVVENMYLNVFIYKIFHATADQISYMVAASAVAATVTTVLMGALSDKMGKRKLFMCGGYLAWGVSILLFALVRMDIIEGLFPMVASAATVGVTLVIILDCLMTFFGSTANDAAFNAWLTDSTNHENRGMAEGINAMMPLVAILVVFGGFMAFNLDNAESWTWIFAIIGGVVLAVGVIGLFVIEEPSITPAKDVAYFKQIAYGFLPSTVKQNKSLYISLVAFIIFNISIQIFMPYLIIYYEVSLKMTNYVLVMAPAIILASVVTALWGKVYDKRGFGFSALMSVAWLMLGYVLLYFFRGVAPVFIGSLLMMSGYLSGMAVFGAQIRDLIPEGKAGRLQGARIVAQVLVPGLVGPFIGKTILRNAEKIVGNDGTESFVPNANIFLGALVAAALLLPFLYFLGKRKPPRLVNLSTPYKAGTQPHSDYHPRPMCQRDSFVSLNGTWSFSVMAKNGKTEPIGDILVPFPPESLASGIGRMTQKGERLLYEKTFSFTPTAKRTILHFGAVDNGARVWLNGTEIGMHLGGYLPFSFDVTEAIKEGENKLSVLVSDNLSPRYPYGKQRYKRGGMWYTPTSGIWQTVWLECVAESYIEKIRITPTLSSVTIETMGGLDKKTLTLGEKTYEYTGNSITVEIEDPILWSPENPHLYPFTVETGEDKISSYFALREMSVKQVNGQSYMCLNGKPYFFHGLLDQGYYADGIYMPKSVKGFEDDILTMKKLGFNMLRKHIKIEPDVFYYLCDKHGMAVFQDMVNNGHYSFFIDTALPTVGLRRGLCHSFSRATQDIFLSHAKDTVDALYNHPSVVYYTIFNEGWGQHKANHRYRLLKEQDPTRVWDTASGWFGGVDSDVQSEHIYFRPAIFKGQTKKPMVLSEFGGYSCKIEEHSFNLDKTYGYRQCATPENFTADLEALYQNEVIPMIRKGLGATVLTQVSDVEDETNGLVTYDRQVIKPDEKRMQDLAKQIFDAFAETVN